MGGWISCNYVVRILILSYLHGVFVSLVWKEKELQTILEEKFLVGSVCHFNSTTVRKQLADTIDKRSAPWIQCVIKLTKWTIWITNKLVM